MGSLYIFSCLVLYIVQSYADETQIACYDDRGLAQRCIPPFENAAFDVNVEASNTCGLAEAEEYCLQTGVTGATKSCTVCDAHDNSLSHPASFLTDFHNSRILSWWQSQTMLQDVQYPRSVNLTLNLGKSFDITYVRLKFYSSRPDSFAIYKRASQDEPWSAYQYYSASCEDTYGKRNKEIITAANEAKAICTDEFSDISPLTGGSVAFSTLEGRPSAYNFEHSAELQEWVTATEIKIVLNRLNTFGDEVFGDPNVLKSYFYAISDFAVGARCKCNGHASECVRSTGQGLEERNVCRCEHNTQGPDCNECQPFYNDRPWRRATADGAHECIACDCNGLSNRCFFDEELYRKTGHGGHCLDCRENTFGIHCERCKDYFYRLAARNKCQSCNCHAIGALYRQCDDNGKCQCKRGVTGDKCDRCDVNFYDFGQSGCRPCQCELAGSLNNHAECLPDSGICKCKEFVEGQNCDRCQPGYFAMSADNPQGCISCFCYGHSSVCSSAPGYTAKVIQSQFNTGRQRWKGIERGGKELTLDYNGVVQHIGISSLGIESSYFLAPARYLGNLKFSYDQVLSFTLRVGGDSARASVLDVIIEGGNNQRISLPIFAQGNAIPRTVNQEYNFRLNEHPNYEWTPNLSSLEFIKLLSNVTALKIRGTYTPLSFGFIDNVKLGSAQPGRSAGGRAVSHVELCQCPQGYVGQFCESCAPGYHRDPPSGGPYARCVPCNCNGHSDTCDVNTGRCICQHNTVGLNCERCLPGYYGYALAGTANDCKVCPCPDNGECVEMINGEVACINCKEGYTGNRCEMCADGYYGDPQGKYGPPRPCQKCICNENIDPNAVANCNSTTGACLKCILNTAGFACAQCLPGYYGDALALPKGQCKACDCYDPGSQGDGLSSCADRSGQCPCLPNVAGLKCDQCWDGYWNIDSERGCERCGCDPVGSLNQTCDVSTGQCLCKPGVGGRTCDSCIEYYFGFSEEGCQMCSCDPAGSYTMQCDEVTGDCQCKTNIIGRRCDRCEENKYNTSAGCIDCPICYNLVQDRVNIHRGKLHDLRELIRQINDNPKVVDDSDFRAKLDSTAATVDDLLEEARKTGGTDGTLADQLGALKAAIDDVISQCGDITMTTQQADGSSKNSIVDITAAEEAIRAAEDALRNAHSHIEIDGIDALEKAKEAQGKYGQESTHMTEIAKEARALAERQEQEAERIEDTANLALNTSQEALRIAQESLHMPTYVADDLGRLQTDVFDAEQLFEGTRNLADKALQEAGEAYKQSLSLYTNADSVVVPKVDVDTLVSEAEDVKTEAAEIKEEADELREQQRTMMADVALQIQSAEETLTGGIRQQQVADELLADADAARAMARDAIAKAEKTLEDAKKALRTFREFDEKIRQSKFDAEDAMHRIPAIEDKIAEAEAKTYTARNNLADAEKDANMARDLAEEAQDIADMASDAAGNISNEAAETKLRAMQLNDEAEQLSNDVDGATLNLEKYEQQAEEDARLVQEALEKADEAKTGAVDSSQRVKTALNTVDDILSQLSNLDSIDTDMLSELELNLYDAEQTIVDADIETKYNDMLASRHQQNIWVRDYTDELIQLRKDVENIRQINDSIPLGCYKSIKLEPVG